MSSDSIRSYKKTLRKEVMAVRNSLTVDYVKKRSRRITESVLSSEVYKASDSVCLYMPINNEVDVSMIIDEVIASGKKVYLPRVVGDEMDFYYYDKSIDLICGPFNILEPQSDEILHPDSSTLIIMPGAVFSTECDRIGYGGGYYDRYLDRYPMVNTVAVAYDFQIKPLFPTEATDIKPDYIIGEENIYANPDRIRTKV